MDEGCVCGHGQYEHGGGSLYGEHSRCIRCACQEFRRSQSGRS